MLNIYLVTSSILALSFVIIALIIFLRNSKSRLNAIFMAMSVSMAIWLVSNYLASDSRVPVEIALIANKFVFAFGISSIFSILTFVKKLLQKRSNKSHKILSIGNYASIVMSLTPFVVKDITVDGTTYAIEFGWFANAYFLIILIDLLAIIYYLTIGSRRLNGVVHAQILTIRYSFLVGLIAIIITNAILPFIFNVYALTNAGSFASLFLVAGIAYAIIKHKLFDIRSIVVRALVYVMAVATIGVLYTALIYGSTSVLIDTSNISNAQRALFAVLALVIAVTYAPVMRFFNTNTNKLFYRDAYDDKRVVDDIGKIIVGSIDLHKIQKSALIIIDDALHTTYLGFILNTGSGVNIQDFQGAPPHFDQYALTRSLKSVGRKIVLYDELEQSDSEKADNLRKNEISIIVPLVTKNETVGYLISGAKKGGNTFSQQDRRMLNTVANELAVALQNAQRFDEIQAFNITLQDKVTEATHELKQTNKKLIALDEAKDEFISMASHQLRTPLTSIKGYLSMLIEGDLGKTSAAQQSALKEAFGSSQRMVYLISDFLNVSRIKTGKFMIEPKEVDLPQIVAEEITQLRDMAGAKDLKLTYEQPEVFPTVMLDDNKIRQVMMNMVDNAIYYTPAGGTITIQLYASAKEIIFKVIDTGIGVPKSEQHKLFTKFYRAGNARKARPDGTGLGLFMAQKIVVEQGGAVIFESVEGKGSTFGFRFPIAKIKANQSH